MPVLCTVRPVHLVATPLTGTLFASSDNFMVYPAFHDGQTFATPNQVRSAVMALNGKPLSALFQDSPSDAGAAATSSSTQDRDSGRGPSHRADRDADGKSHDSRSHRSSDSTTDRVKRERVDDDDAAASRHGTGANGAIIKSENGVK